MLKTAVAMLASTLAMSGYNIADTFFVGHIGGVAPLAAMGFTFPVIMLAGCFFGGFGGGCMALMAQALGAKDIPKANLTVSSGMLLVALIAMLFAGLGIAFADPLYSLMGAEGEVLEELKRYMNVWFIGCFTAGLLMPGNHLLIAAGRTKTASAMTILGMTLNVLLDPIMIFGGPGCAQTLCTVFPENWHALINASFGKLDFIPAMGISGAAWATIASQAVSSAIIIVILCRVGLLSFKPIQLPTLFKSWRAIAGYAIPNILGMILVPITNYITTWVTAKFGNEMVAAAAAGSKIEHVCFVFPMAFGIPLMPIIAQNFGAGKYDRVKFAYRFASGIALGFLLATAVGLLFFADKIVPFFSPETEVQRLMVAYLHITAWGYGFLELTRFSGFALTGTGHPIVDSCLKSGRLLLLLIPLSLLAYAIKWQEGVFYARLAADLIGGAICWTTAACFVNKLGRVPPLVETA